MRRIFILAAILCVAACKREEKASMPKCSDDLARNDVMRLQGAARSGTDPCPELTAPKLLLDAHGLSVDGTIKVAAADLPTSTPQNIAPLFQSFVGKRRLWKQIHPGESFSAKVNFDAAPDSSAVAGASVMRSIAWAGYEKIHLVAGDVTVDFECVTPKPPGAPQDTDVVRVKTAGTMHDLANEVKAELDKPGAHAKKQISFDRSS